VVNLEFDLINLRNELDAAGRGAARDKIEQARTHASVLFSFELVCRVHPNYMT
jgi:hypothetical protein